MAIIEVARIQVRRGQEKQTGVPPLAGGEFAWAADTEKLYIGLRREDGGSRDANIEVLTEQHLRNLFEFTVNTVTSYVYRYGSDITAEVSTEYERNLLEKLDDQVSVKDFGIEGNGVDDVTALLRMTVDRLFLSTSTYQPYPGVSAAKVLYFPTGVYNISDTIFIPKNTIIKGEGIGNTIINLTTTGTHVFETVDSSSVGSVLAGDSGYVRFPSINSGDTQPDNIVIEGMTLQHSTSSTVTGALSLIKMAASSNSIIREVKFKGIRTNVDSVNTSYSGVEILGYQSLTSDNVKIENCEFNDLYYGVKSNHDIMRPIISDSTFKDCRVGVAFNVPKDSSALIGPRFARISNNRFEDIETEAIYVGENNIGSSEASITGTNIISMNNQFINVGNYKNVWGDASTTGTSIITFLSDQNSSVGDYFDRREFQAKNISSPIRFNRLVTGSSIIEEPLIRRARILASSSNCVFRVPFSVFQQSFFIRYLLTNSIPQYRSGIIHVNVGGGILSPSSPSPSITDDYNYSSATDSEITWSTIVNVPGRWIEFWAANPAIVDTDVYFQLVNILT
jgi:hypothetical protein